jgi:hypothetical protein
LSRKEFADGADSIEWRNYKELNERAANPVQEPQLTAILRV